MQLGAPLGGNSRTTLRAMTEEVLTTVQRLKRRADRVFHTIAEACQEAAEGLLMPSTCLGCGEVGGSLCAECRCSVQAAGPPVRVSVGKQGERIAVHAAVRYEGAVASALRGFKDHGRSDCAPILADWLGAAMTSALERLPSNVRSIEVLFPPSNRTKIRERGYHPVRLLLRELGVQPGLRLNLSRATKDQREMDLDGRERNLKGAFVSPENLAGRTFLLIDDVCTTGATLAEMARAVGSGGGSALAAAVVARVPRHGAPGREAFPSPLSGPPTGLPITAFW